MSECWVKAYELNSHSNNYSLFNSNLVYMFTGILTKSVNQFLLQTYHLLKIP